MLFTRPFSGDLHYLEGWHGRVSSSLRVVAVRPGANDVHDDYVVFDEIGEAVDIARKGCVLAVLDAPPMATIASRVRNLLDLDIKARGLSTVG